MSKKHRFAASGTNVFIVPIGRKNNTWVGRVHSVGKTGSYYLKENDIVIYVDEDVTELEASDNSLTIHSVIYFRVLGKKVEIEKFEKTGEF